MRLLHQELDKEDYRYAGRSEMSEEVFFSLKSQTGNELGWLERCKGFTFKAEDVGDNTIRFTRLPAADDEKPEGVQEEVSPPKVEMPTLEDFKEFVDKPVDDSINPLKVTKKKRGRPRTSPEA